MTEFSEDHIGRRVVAQSGVEIGTVEDVRDGDLYVDVEPTDERDTMSKLGWDGPVNQDLHFLPDQYVSNVTDATVRLTV